MKTINMVVFMMIFTLSTTTTFTGCADSNSTTSSDGVTPTITLHGNKNIEIPLGTTSIPEDGYTAVDFQDGDITENVTISNNIDVTKAGYYEVRYSVTDSDGNVATAIRTVRIIGNDGNNSSDSIYNGSIADENSNNGSSNNYQGSAPIILFNQDIVYLTLGENFHTSQYYNDYRATDVEDGDLTSQVQIDDSGFNSNITGTYIITYSVTDSNQNYTSKDKSVVIQNNYNNGGNNSSYSELDNFKLWYSNTCGRTFNESLYNDSTRKYHGKIDCSNQGLSSIDLSTLSIFDGIDDLDLSHNNLSHIDFSPIKDIHEMWALHIDHNTQTLKRQYDTKSERNALFRYFRNIHGGDGNTHTNEAGVYIYFKQHRIIKIFFDKENK